MKKFFYILLSGFLGALLGFLVHALIEIFVIWIMLVDFDKYSLGLSWNQLVLIRAISASVLCFLGLSMGVWLGFKWWQYVYVNKKYSGRWIKNN